MDRDRAVSGFITRIVTVRSASNYQHRRTVVNLAFTHRLSLLVCLIGQGKSVLVPWKLRGLRKCATGSLMKSDERRSVGGGGGGRGRKMSYVYGEFTDRDGLKFLVCAGHEGSARKRKSGRRSAAFI